MKFLDRWLPVLREWLSAPGRRQQLAAAALGFLALVGAFQLGQMRAGYNAIQSEISQRRARQEASRLKAENRELAGKLAKLQTDDQVNTESYAQIEEQLAELQGKLIEQQEELAFYQGVVGGDSKGALGVQDFSLVAGQSGIVRLRFVLTQHERTEREVSGQLQMQVDGLKSGRTISLDMASLGDEGPAVPRAFRFRYFQEITASLRIPADFKPERVVIRIAPTSSGLKGSVESFPWSVRGG